MIWIWCELTDLYFWNVHDKGLAQIVWVRQLIRTWLFQFGQFDYDSIFRNEMWVFIVFGRDLYNLNKTESKKVDFGLSIKRFKSLLEKISTLSLHMSYRPIWLIYSIFRIILEMRRSSKFGVFSTSEAFRGAKYYLVNDASVFMPVGFKTLCRFHLGLCDSHSRGILPVN